MSQNHGRAQVGPSPSEAPVIVAKLLKPVGLRGAVKAESWSDAPDRFRAGAGFWVLSEPPTRVTLVSAGAAPKGYLLLRFEGYDSVDAVQDWRGCLLGISESERAPLADGLFYHDELKGMAVITDKGRTVGSVNDVWTSGPQDLLAIVGDEGERLLPMVREFVVRIDRAARQITVRPPDGW